MINFDALTLKAFISENEDYLTGATIKKIQQPSRRELVLQLRNNGENKKLYFNINPEFFHICFTEDLQKRGISIPDAAPMFCMLLRKYLQNAKIAKVFQPFGERIIELHFQYKDALEDVQTVCLTTELMGKYSNIILYNYDSKMIYGCAHNVGEEKSKVRELSGTLPYVYPVKQDKSDFLKVTFSDFLAIVGGNCDETSLAFELSNDYHYITMPFVKQVLKMLNTNFSKIDDVKNLYEKIRKTVSLQEYQPSVNDSCSEYSLVLGAGMDFCPKENVNEMIDFYFTENQIQKILKQKKTRIFNHLDILSKKLTKQVDNFNLKMADVEKADVYRLKGDILMMNINEKVAPKLSLQNPYDATVVEIELDERFSIVQNANRYYKLYKKTKNAINYAASQIDELQAEISKIEEQKFYTEIASSIADVDEILSELGLNKDAEMKKTKKVVVNLECHDIDGFKVYLGKNSVQNDYLLSKVASPEDLWFHPLNMHGAHVILKKNDKKVSNEVLLACAKLAKRFSKAQNDAKIPIIYTERKYVKKANSKLAFVTYKNETEIYC